MKLRPFLLCCLLLASGLLLAQRQRDRAADLTPVYLIHLGYGPQTAQADLGQRFGSSWSLELGLDRMAKGSNWSIGPFGQYFFGSEVKEDVLAGLRTADGLIIGNQRDPADIQLRMRAYFAGLRASKILPLSTNKRAGIKLSIGGGWLEHRIRIQRDPVHVVNQLVGDYATGYDRLSSGPTAYQFIGYQQLSADGLLNFQAGFELMEAFTTGKRDFDFATAGSLRESRLDVLLGFRLGFILTLYRGEGREIFYR